MVPSTTSGKPIGQGNSPSGLPGPHKLGASKQEAIALLVAFVILALIVASFWFEATR